jgi:hypothetical protein
MTKDFLKKLEWLQKSMNNPQTCEGYNNAQLHALKILGENRTRDAESIDTLAKLLILLTFGPKYIEEAKRFPDHNQNAAMNIITDCELAIQVQNPFQVEALKILGDNKEALEYTNTFQIEALKILGRDSKGVAPKFDNPHKLDALKILGNSTLAVNFDTREKVMALYILGKNETTLALEFELYSQVTALKLLQHLPHKALEFTNNFQTKALKIVGAQNADLALRVVHSRQVLCLEECINETLEEYTSCIGTLYDNW